MTLISKDAITYHDHQWRRGKNSSNLLSWCCVSLGKKKTNQRNRIDKILNATAHSPVPSELSPAKKYLTATTSSDNEIRKQLPSPKRHTRRETHGSINSGDKNRILAESSFSLVSPNYRRPASAISGPPSNSRNIQRKTSEASLAFQWSTTTSSFFSTGNAAFHDPRKRCAKIWRPRPRPGETSPHPPLPPLVLIVAEPFAVPAWMEIVVEWSGEKEYLRRELLFWCWNGI